MTDPGSELAHPAAGPAFSTSVTFGFADPRAGLYGVARLGLAGAGGARVGSALAVLHAGREPVVAHAQDGIPVDDGAGVERLALPGLEATVEDPLRRWSLRSAGGEHELDLAFEASGPPAGLEPSEPAALAGGMSGYVQVCRVLGTARLGGRAHELRGLGERSHVWGEPDWRRIGSTRTLGAWLDDGTGVAALAVRPAESVHHEHEVTWAALLGTAGHLRVDEPRLSTTYDDGGRQRRANLELWVGADDAYPRRATGEVVCGSTLELGDLRLDCGFMRCRVDGRPAVGRYDLLRRA